MISADFLELLMIGAKLENCPPPVTEIWEVELLSLDALNMPANIPNAVQYHRIWKRSSNSFVFAVIRLIRVSMR